MQVNGTISEVDDFKPQLVDAMAAALELDPKCVAVTFTQNKGMVTIKWWIYDTMEAPFIVREDDFQDILDEELLKIEGFARGNMILLLITAMIS